MASFGLRQTRLRCAVGPLYRLAMTTHEIIYIGGPADGHVDLLDASASRLWIPRPIKRIRTADGHRTPFIEALSDAELGVRLLDAALYRDDALPPAEWMIEEQIYGVYLAHPSRAAMHFTPLVQRHTGRMSATQHAYRRLGIFLFREAAIQDRIPQLVGAPDDDFLRDISTLFPTDLALIARATEAHRMRLRLWAAGQP